MRKFSSPSGVEVMAEEVNAGYFPSPHTPKTKHNISSSYVKGKSFVCAYIFHLLLYMMAASEARHTIYILKRNWDACGDCVMSWLSEGHTKSFEFLQWN